MNYLMAGLVITHTISLVSLETVVSAGLSFDELLKFTAICRPADAIHLREFLLPQRNAAQRCSHGWTLIHVWQIHRTLHTTLTSSMWTATMASSASKIVTQQLDCLAWGTQQFPPSSYYRSLL